MCFLLELWHILCYSCEKYCLMPIQVRKLVVKGLLNFYAMNENTVRLVMRKVSICLIIRQHLKPCRFHPSSYSPEPSSLLCIIYEFEIGSLDNWYKFIKWCKTSNDSTKYISSGLLMVS